MKEFEMLHKLICHNFCDSLKLSYVSSKLTRIDIPFFFPDGDPYQLFIAKYSSESLVLTDLGHTLMHLSYENDIDKFFEGTRGKIIDQIYHEFGLIDNKSELMIETNEKNIISDLFKLTQAITKTWDLTFLNKEKARSTFYEDLNEVIKKALPDNKVVEHYKHPKIQNNQYYPIDYYVKTKTNPLYIFGIAGKDKARLTTITLEKLNTKKLNFKSAIIFENTSSIPKNDLERLKNIENTSVLTIDKPLALEKQLKRIAA